MFACVHGAEWPSPWAAAECPCTTSELPSAIAGLGNTASTA